MSTRVAPARRGRAQPSARRGMRRTWRTCWTRVRDCARCASLTNPLLDCSLHAVAGSRFPSSKLMLDNLFINWLAVPESQKLVRWARRSRAVGHALFGRFSQLGGAPQVLSLLEDAKAGRPVAGPSTSRSALSPTTAASLLAGSSPMVRSCKPHAASWRAPASRAPARPRSRRSRRRRAVRTDRTRCWTRAARRCRRAAVARPSAAARRRPRQQLRPRTAPSLSSSIRRRVARAHLACRLRRGC